MKSLLSVFRSHCWHWQHFLLSKSTTEQLCGWCCKLHEDSNPWFCQIAPLLCPKLIQIPEFLHYWPKNHFLSTNNRITHQNVEFIVKFFAQNFKNGYNVEFFGDVSCNSFDFSLQNKQFNFWVGSNSLVAKFHSIRSPIHSNDQYFWQPRRQMLQVVEKEWLFVVQFQKMLLKNFYFFSKISKHFIPVINANFPVKLIICGIIVLSIK